MSRKIPLVPGAGALARMSGGSGVFVHAMVGVPALPFSLRGPFTVPRW
ncbi:hypothetical protein [Actinocorallia populi]|nr:hypothetical protein [Actinocorallia populi]